MLFCILEMQINDDDDDDDDDDEEVLLNNKLSFKESL